MLELNSKPKKLIVQRHSKSNNWLTEAVMVKSEEETDHRRWTVDEVYYLLETFQIPSDDSYGDLDVVPVRIVNEHGKVILSTASHDFLIEAGRSGHITVREPIETVDGKTAYAMECYSAKNDAYPHIREFQKYIGRHKGISHVTKYPRNEYDGWEQVWKVYFKDKTFVTVGTHHLYESGGMIISHFAKDKIGY